MSEVVLLAGSLTLRSLPISLETELEVLIASNSEFLVGDAHGADLLLQEFLKRKAVRSVTVFYSNAIRNNAGSWVSNFVESNLKSRGKDSHAAKDREMCRLASAGLVVWDGRSAGTLANVIDLVEQGKSVKIFYTDQKSVSLSTRQAVETLCSSTQESQLALTEAVSRLRRYRDRASRSINVQSDTLF